MARNVWQPIRPFMPSSAVRRWIIRQASTLFIADSVSVPVLARKPGALRNGAPFKDWLLPASLERIRRKLQGSDDGDRQMVKVLSAVLTDGLAAVEAACAEALADGVHSADVVLNILSRRRDPGPATTILTPDALRLQHLPIADCARYDSLRRAS